MAALPFFAAAAHTKRAADYLNQKATAMQVQKTRVAHSSHVRQ